MWYDEFNSVFFTGIATMIVAGIGLLVRYAFRSKCDNINLCFGCINIHRKVELELEEPEADDGEYQTDDQNETDEEFKNP